MPLSWSVPELSVFEFVVYRSNGLREAKRVEAEPSHDVVEGPAQRVRRLSPQQLPVFREVESAHVPAALLREVRREAVGDETADEGGAGRLGYAERPRQLGAGDPRVLADDLQSQVPVVREVQRAEHALRLPVEGSHEVVKFVDEVHNQYLRFLS